MRSEVFGPGHFTGDTLSWHAAGAILSEVRHRSARSVGPHSHGAAYCSLLLEGSYAERGADFNLRYEPYTLVFHSANTVHEDEMGTRTRFFAVELLERWHRVIEDLGGARAHVFELEGGDAAWLVLRLYREFLQRDAGSESSVEALVYELCGTIAKFSEEETEEPEWLALVDATIRERFALPLHLEAIAATAGVHPAHVCRSYRRFRRRTISDALLRLRIAQVCRLLVESKQSLTAIALDCGFTDQSHMTRIFKRLTGRSPGAHRREERAHMIESSCGE